MAKRLKITQRKSAIGYPRRQKLTIRALGIRRLNHSVIHQDTPQIRGMLRKVSHLVTIEELGNDTG